MIEEDIKHIRKLLTDVDKRLYKLERYVIAEKQHKKDFSEDQELVKQGKPPRKQPKSFNGGVANMIVGSHKRWLKNAMYI